MIRIGGLHGGRGLQATEGEVERRVGLIPQDWVVTLLVFIQLQLTERYAHTLLF